MSVVKGWIQSVDPANGKGKWVPEDDANLTEAVQRVSKDWVAVAIILLLW
jgi:hypothetical protein